MIVIDWIPLFPLNDLAAAQAGGFGRRLASSLGNTLPVALVLATFIAYFNQPFPLWATAYDLFYVVVFLVLVWLAWYGPYFFGTKSEREVEAMREYGKTVQCLPKRGNNVRPNLAHEILHILFILSALSLALRLSA